jgi:hypothetical protein
MSEDALSDLLRAVRLRGAVFHHASNWGAWAAEAPPVGAMASAVMPGAEHVMEFHLGARGEGGVAIQDVAPARLESGDIVIFPRDDRHVESSAPGLTPQRVDADGVFATRRESKPIPIGNHRAVAEPGSAGPFSDADTVLVCGFVGGNLRPFNRLVAVRPRLLCETPRSVAAIALGAGYELEAAFNRVFKRFLALSPAAAARRVSAHPVGSPGGGSIGRSPNPHTTRTGSRARCPFVERRTFTSSIFAGARRW